jgi:hypothetical protein
MHTSISRPFTAFTLFAVAVCALALSSEAPAAGRGGLINKGVYSGLWHGDQVKIIVEKVSRDGKFEGVIHFDPKGRWGDFKANFCGTIGARDSIVIKRLDCGQQSVAGAPRREGRALVWKGDTMGEGLDRAYRFEMRVPR